MENKRKAWAGRILCLFVLLVPIEFLRAQEQPAAKQAIDAGKRVFSGSCGMAYCHGADAVGGGGPRLRDREFSAEYLTRVINDGIPGTGMPGFKTNLKKEQIAQLVTYLLSLNKELVAKSGDSRIDPHFGGGAAPATTEVKSAPRSAPLPAVDLTGTFGDAVAGAELFFDAAQLQNCRVCHTVAGRGGKVASDLSRLSDQSPKEIFARLLAPHASLDGKHGMQTVTLKSGERITGIARDEDKTSLRLYDTASLPPISRNFLKSEIAKVEKLSASGCPGNYAARFTLKQLLDLVALIKTTDLEKPARVTLQEIF